MKQQNLIFLLGLIIGMFIGGLAIWNINTIVDEKLSVMSDLIHELKFKQKESKKQEKTEKEPEKEIQLIQ